MILQTRQRQLDMGLVDTRTLLVPGTINWGGGTNLRLKVFRRFVRFQLRRDVDSDDLIDVGFWQSCHIMGRDLPDSQDNSPPTPLPMMLHHSHSRGRC